MKDCYLKVRCTEKEKRIIKCMAEQNGMNMSEYILSLVMSNYMHYNIGEKHINCTGHACTHEQKVKFESLIK